MPLSWVGCRDGGQASASPGNRPGGNSGRSRVYKRARWPWARLGKYLSGAISRAVGDLPAEYAEGSSTFVSNQTIDAITHDPRLEGFWLFSR
jgi:hypothetical protein